MPKKESKKKPVKRSVKEPAQTRSRGIEAGPPESSEAGFGGDGKPQKPAALKEGEPRPDEQRRDRYFEAVGRRKTAIARVRLYTRAGDFTVNEKLYTLYFPTFELQKIIEEALQKMKLMGRFRVSVKVSGGGIHVQAEAVRHGLARCLVKFNPDFRKRLKRAEFLRRDPRMRERKKFGLKKARRAPQWAKR